MKPTLLPYRHDLRRPVLPMPRAAFEVPFSRVLWYALLLYVAALVAWEPALRGRWWVWAGLVAGLSAFEVVVRLRTRRPSLRHTLRTVVHTRYRWGRRQRERVTCCGMRVERRRTGTVLRHRTGGRLALWGVPSGWANRRALWLARIVRITFCRHSERSSPTTDDVVAVRVRPGSCVVLLSDGRRLKLPDVPTAERPRRYRRLLRAIEHAHA